MVNSVTLVVLLILIIISSGNFGLLHLSNSTQVGAEDQRITNYAFEATKSHALPKMVMFEVPSKQVIKDNKKPIDQNLFKQLLAQADSSLTKESTSVMDKKQTPPSGDKHDYLSLGRYYWPDLTKPNHMPYMYRDGQLNPETYSIPDERNMAEMIDRVKTLSVAYYLTDNPLYASKASDLLRVWFLDDDTRMNPNLQYAQMQPGRNYGRYSGIIDTHDFPAVLDAITLIRDSSAWTEKDQKGIELWFDKYLEWLLNSDFGKSESEQLNNHGTWYDVQVASIALFLNKTEITRDILKNNIDKLIAAKIRPDGSQRFELDRPTSLSYHMFNLAGFFNLAKIGDSIGIDLWNYKTPEGSGLQKALDYLLPYALGKETWPHEQIKPIYTDQLRYLLCQATVHYEWDESYKQASVKLNTAEDTNGLTYEGLTHGCASRIFN